MGGESTLSCERCGRESDNINHVQEYDAELCIVCFDALDNEDAEL